MSPEQSAPLGEPWPQPSMIGPKGRLRNDPDLVEQYQLAKIALAHLMTDRGISQFVVTAEAVERLRMSTVEITPDESDRLFVKLES